MLAVVDRPVGVDLRLVGGVGGEENEVLEAGSDKHVALNLSIGDSWIW